MQLTVFANDGDQTFFVEVDPSMTVEDLVALIGAEAGADAESISLVFNGRPLGDTKKDLASYGMTGNEEIVQMTTSRTQASGSQQNFGGASNAMEANLERMRLSALGDPIMMEELRRNRPDLAEAIQSPEAFAQVIRQMAPQRNEVEMEKERQIQLLNSDPYDIEAQKKIEEMIRQQAVMENLDHAMEYSPESFGNVHMLYIDVEVNGHKVKAFVDSGAQTTIISPDCAEQCGLMRLLDTRYAGVARGVGTAKILGRIHSAQIRLGDLHLPVAFSVLEGRDVDLLFGLDMLKRHQACIDLEKNVLRIQGREVRFLAEHELPDKARETEELAEEMDTASATGNLPLAPKTPVSGPSTTGAGSSTQNVKPPAAVPTTSSSSGQGSSKFPESSIQAIMNLGVSREHAISTLEAAGGDIDVAASLLF